MMGQSTGAQAPPHLVLALEEGVGTSSAAQVPRVQEALSVPLCFLSPHPQLSQIGVELKCPRNNNPGQNRASQKEELVAEKNLLLTTSS